MGVNIAEIKKKLNVGDYAYYKDGLYGDSCENADEDIEYLLSIIEQAEKALDRLYLACPPPEPSMFIEEGYNEEEYVEAVGEAIEALKAMQGDET